MKKYECPCCGFYTFDEKPNGSYDICPVCFWEDDLIQLENIEYEGGANKVSLVQARRNFLVFGACEEDMKKYVRRPTEEEFHYKILMVSEESRWIYLSADRWDCEEPDAFVALVKRIAEDLKGTIVDKGMTTYQIENDPCRLTYQWDTCFGITVAYPEDVSSSVALDFLNKYF